MSGPRLIGHAMAGIMEWFRPTFPPVVRIETTNHCNARCTFCPRESMGRPTSFMPRDLYERIVSQCAVNGCRTIHLHNFGEPLLDTHLPERIRFAKERGIRRTKIFSNAALLRGAMAERLLDCGLDELKISIDGANAGEFNELRRGLSHAAVMENTRSFKRLRDERRPGGPPAIIATCALTPNKRQTARTLRDAVDRIDYPRLHNWAGARTLGGNGKLRQPCHRLWRTFTILVNGDVALCCLDHAGKEIPGNCRDELIADIWNNHRYQELRRLHRSSEQQRIPLCRTCSASFF